VNALLQPVGRDLFATSVGLHPVREWTTAAEGLVELPVRLQVLLGIALGDVHIEICLDLIDETDLLPGELTGGAGKGAQVSGDVIGTRLVELRRRRGHLRAALSAGGRPGGPGRRGRGVGLVGDGLTQRWVRR